MLLIHFNFFTLQKDTTTDNTITDNMEVPTVMREQPIMEPTSNLTKNYNEATVDATTKRKLEDVSEEDANEEHRSIRRCTDSVHEQANNPPVPTDSSSTPEPCLRLDIVKQQPPLTDLIKINDQTYELEQYTKRNQYVLGLKYIYGRAGVPDRGKSRRKQLPQFVDVLTTPLPGLSGQRDGHRTDGGPSTSAFPYYRHYRARRPW